MAAILGQILLEPPMTHFKTLGLPSTLLTTLTELGYESPSPVQAKAIPLLLGNEDLVAQAQTGTGKTAAFALPILAKIDPAVQKPQALVLAPTRELALQVAEAFHRYAKTLKNFHVLPIYGGQEYRTQLRGLKRGAHVIVGTPGRVMDHLRRGTLDTSHLQTLVLDEADEMLKMGFLEDVEWILEQIPQQHQTALFSATMPASIRKIAETHLISPQQVKIQPSEKSLKNIKQYYTKVLREHKLEALTRFLEVEPFSAAIIFTRTKLMAAELSDKLEARGHNAAAIHGDMAQNAREKVIKRLKSNALDIIVATEVAARGLDIDRIDFVINYDIPTDLESYVHRIGRTGRAGREGRALVLVSPRELNMLRDIERFTQVKMQHLKAPSVSDIKTNQVGNLMAKVTDILQQQDVSDWEKTLAEYLKAHKHKASQVAAAMMALLLDQQKQIYLDIDIAQLVEEKLSAKPRGNKRPRQDFHSKKPRHFYEARKRKQNTEGASPKKHKKSKLKRAKKS